MRVNPSIFRAYDVRGIYPSELNEEVASEIGKIFVGYTKAKKVAIGRDCRLSSPSIFRALTRGITDSGSDVYDIGKVPTECVYFSVGFYGYDAGIMITASHNPKEYNGLKMVKKNGEFVRGSEIGKEFGKMKFPKTKKKGKIRKLDVWQDYLEHIFSFAKIEKIMPYKIVIDAGNGMAGSVIPLLEKKLPIKIISLNFNLDGNFPAHSPNPLAKGTTLQISQKIKKLGADFGFIFDGDADRIFLLDEKGNLIPGDVALLLVAKYFLKKNSGLAVVYNLISSKAVPEFIKKWGGRPILSPVGFVNIREKMRKEDAIMGGELSGHYCFKGNFYSDSAFIAFLILVQLISEGGKKVSEITSPLSPYFKSPEINFKIKEKEAVLDEIKKRYSDAKRLYLDGITAEYDDWWFNLRPSQTEPILRLVLEAKTKKLFEKKKKELIELIKLLC
jgi:phosphomannomutase